MYFRDSAAVRKHPQAVFGDRIRELRQASNLTQEDLATRCGLFRTYMSRIETGQANPTLTMIHALADSLGVPITTLFDASEPVAKPRASARPSRGRVAR
ncbi:helix-turn-helix domain-containing protein [Paucibacter sp. JuS9]|uniref:helix-turn-helix domain-containing protein n=1 Tax=Paucibacter sp. JuS9 TaxID=3228748 RepID=UPI0037563FFB